MPSEPAQSLPDHSVCPACGGNGRCNPLCLKPTCSGCPKCGGSGRDRLRAENEALKAILDGCDDAAIERAARVLAKDGGADWDEMLECGRDSYRTYAVGALRAAGERSVAPDEQEATS